MQNNPFNLMQRLRFRLSKKMLLDEGVFYKYYAVRLHGKHTIVKQNPHSRKPDFRTISIDDYLCRFRNPDDIATARRELQGFGFALP